MNQEKDYLKDLTEIRSMMERSSRFISLSGLSGVSAGIFAIIGAFAAYKYLELGAYRIYYEGAVRAANDYLLRSEPNSLDVVNNSSKNLNIGFILFIVLDAAAVLFCSLAVGVFFTTRKAKNQGLKIWDKSAKQLIINLFIPLTAGAIFCIAMLYHGVIGLIAPATLVFYGLALINGSKYTLDDVKYLGICEIALGIISAFFLGYGFLFWVIGFGILHIVYGTVMYFKYEYKK